MYNFRRYCSKSVWRGFRYLTLKSDKIVEVIGISKGSVHYLIWNFNNEEAVSNAGAMFAYYKLKTNSNENCSEKFRFLLEK